MAKWCIKIGDAYLNDEGLSFGTTVNKAERYMTTDYANIPPWVESAKKAHPDEHVRAVRLVPRKRASKPSTVEYATTSEEYSWDRDEREGGGTWVTPTPVPPKGEGWRIVAMAIGTGTDNFVIFAWTREKP